MSQGSKGWAELSDRRAYPVPYPTIVLSGCRPLVPYHGVPLYDPNLQGPTRSGRLMAPFHAPPIRPEQVGDHPWPGHDCPACRGNVASTLPEQGTDGAVVRYCEFCGGMGEPWETNAATQRVLHEDREAVAATSHAIQHEAVSVVAEGATLTELERRRLWNGYCEGSRLEAIDDRHPRFTPAVRRCRQWLADIGQAPDWDVVLDTRGKVAGRLSEGFLHPEATDESP